MIDEDEFPLWMGRQAARRAGRPGGLASAKRRKREKSGPRTEAAAEKAAARDAWRKPSRGVDIECLGHVGHSLSLGSKRDAQGCGSLTSATLFAGKTDGDRGRGAGFARPRRANVVR